LYLVWCSLLLVGLGGMQSEVRKIMGRHYLFVSVAHPWNECAVYLCDKEGNVQSEEPVLFRVGADVNVLTEDLLKEAKE
jgi:hypothetical protein